MRAILCASGHQDVFRLLGRDPDAEPLTAIELAVFALLLEEHSVKKAQLAVLSMNPLA